MMTNRTEHVAGRQSVGAVSILVLVFYVLMVTVNALANILPINNLTTGEVSKVYPNLFAPAPITFSVWGVIYLLLACFAIYQLFVLRNPERAKRKELLQKIRIYFILSSAANIAWIFSWHHFAIGLSIVFMFLILLCLIIINNELKQEFDKQSFNRQEAFFLKLPFRVYFGWITVATIANIVVFLVGRGWNSLGIPEVLWTILLLGAGFVIALFVMFHYRDIPYGLVVLWAYAGILLKHISQDGFDGKYPSIIIAAAAGMVLLVIAIGYLLMKKNRAVV